MDKLVRIMSDIGFDGYLINVEIDIPPDKLQLFMLFLSVLNLSCKSINENAEIIWYDAIIDSGELRY